MKRVGNIRRNQNFGLTSKKGNAFLDLMLVLLVLIGMAIIGLVSHNMFKDLNDDIQADADISPSVKAHSQDLQTRFPTFMDAAFLLAFILLWIFVIVSSVMIDTHPMFFVVTLILLLFAFVVVMMLSNTFEEFTEDTEYIGLNTEFPITYFIMDNLLIIFISIAASVLIVLYGKNKFVG